MHLCPKKTHTPKVAGSVHSLPMLRLSLLLCKAINTLGNIVFSDPEIYVPTSTLVLSRTLQPEPPFSQGLFWEIVSI